MHLFVSGPPGIGKTVVSQALATILGAAFVDTDEEIARTAGKSCSAVIMEDGMRRFRDLESEVLRRQRRTPAWVVVAAGGGSTIRPENREQMRSLGLVIGLRGSVATVARGLALTMAKRPHLDVGPREHAARVLRERRAVYADVDVGFEVGRATPVEIARSIAAWLATARGVRIDVRSARPYPVLVRAGLLAHIGEHLRDLGWAGRVALVSDSRSARLHAGEVLRSLERAGMRATAIRIPEGERAKTLRALGELWRGLAAAGIGRDGGIVALGGGTCGDAAGFAAATYLRGIAVAHVPTTLLAMVDSSIGGKTGIDLPEGKNLVGAFHAPAAVLGDPSLLATLPARQLSSGLAEVVKTAYLADRASVAQASRSVGRVLEGDLAATLGLITMSAEMKAAIVSVDERETGLRELLNFGHTFGHAYEAASGYLVTHGEAVAIGMVFAAALAERLGLSAPALRRDLETILGRAGLPVRARIPRAAWAFVGRDKKARAGRVRWILPRRIGRFSEVTDVDPRSLEHAARVVEGRVA